VNRRGGVPSGAAEFIGGFGGVSPHQLVYGIQVTHQISEEPKKYRKISGFFLQRKQAYITEEHIPGLKQKLEDRVFQCLYLLTPE